MNILDFLLIISWAFMVTYESFSIKNISYQLSIKSIIPTIFFSTVVFERLGDNVKATLRALSRAIKTLPSCCHFWRMLLSILATNDDSSCPQCHIGPLWRIPEVFWPLLGLNHATCSANQCGGFFIVNNHGVMVLWGFDFWVPIHENLLQFQEMFIVQIDKI